MSEKQREALIAECQRQYESCLYTAASLWIYQRSARRQKLFFIVAPIIFAALAGSDILGYFGSGETGLALFFALLAGFFPSIYSALELGLREKEIGRAAADFTKLRDDFRQLAHVHSHESFSDFFAKFERVKERKEFVRCDAPNAPERFFKDAQAKINKGDYTFWVDDQRDPTLPDAVEDPRLEG
ncbi:hypothetical protein WKH79_05440 [Qipengyuania sp. GPGPB31]|uniref:hypothetical protein n=1 Tax=Qipengyuania sp. GPGPB31 TaxID=3023518 RepID=UPI0031342655